MIAEVISIGDELTSGQRLDTNSQWLSEQLGQLGVRVVYHTTVADELAANVEVFRQAVARADVVVATGGLGPTADDLTRDALAAVAGVELVFDAESLAHIESLFARFQRDMPERNRVQAMFPTGSRPIFNPNGTAPGIALEVPRPAGGTCRVFALPGVPAEMREMFDQSVAGEIARLVGTPQVIRHRRIKCFGVGESHLEALLPDLIRRGRTPSVGITVHDATITLRITAQAATPEACLAMMEPTIATIRECLGPIVFGEEDDELEDAVLALLRQRGQTLSTAEGGTGGLLAQWLSRSAPSETSYRGGWVSPDPAVLVAARESSELDGPATAQTLAAACRAHFHSDYGLAVGPFPAVDPGRGNPQSVYLALAGTAKPIVKSSLLAGHPSIWKPRAAKLALNVLRLALMPHVAGSTASRDAGR